MNMDAVLHNLGVRDDTLSEDEKRFSEDEKRFLDEKGYLPLPDLMTPEQIASLGARLEELIRIEGEDAGKEVNQEAGTKRLSDLINKDPMFDLCYHPSPPTGRHRAYSDVRFQGAFAQLSLSDARTGSPAVAHGLGTGKSGRPTAVRSWRILRCQLLMAARQPFRGEWCD